MKKTQAIQRRIILFATVSLALTVISIALRCVNLSFFYDSDIGYYTRGALLPALGNILLFFSLLFFAIFPFFIFRKADVAYSPKTPLSARIAAAVPAIGFLILAVTDLTDPKLTVSIPFLSCALSIIAAVYFILVALEKATPLSSVLCGFCAILRLVLALGSSYFDVTVPMNAPDKLLFQFACLGGMVFLVSELRAVASKARPFLYFFAAGCAVLFLGTSSLPSLFAAHASILKNTELLFSYYMLASLFVYVAVRLFTVVQSQNAPEAQAEPPVIVEEATELPADDSGYASATEENETAETVDAVETVEPVESVETEGSGESEKLKESEKLNASDTTEVADLNEDTESIES